MKQGKEEAHACLVLGDIFQKLKQHEKAIECYQYITSMSEKLEDEKNAFNRN